MISHTELWDENTMAIYSDRIIDNESELIGLALIRKYGTGINEETKIFQECQKHEMWKVRQICKDFLDKRYKELQKENS